VLRPLDLGLILSYQCQAECAHCLYNCGRGWRDWMDPSEIWAAFDAMASWNHRFQVHITGGEPFLRFDLLCEAVRAASAHGIPCYVETNAGWCVRESTVRKRFERLRQLGLRAVLISCSPFHAETIPLAHVERAFRIAHEFFDQVILYLPEWFRLLADQAEETPIPLESWISAYGAERAGRLFWEGYGLIPGGRSAYRLGSLADKRPTEAYKGQACSRELLYAPHSHFDLYGNFIPAFCGGLRLGDWHSLDDLMVAYQHEETPELIGRLIQGGPFGLSEWAAEAHGYRERPEGYVGKCHLCVDVRRHLSSLVQDDALAPQGFYQQF